MLLAAAKSAGDLADAIEAVQAQIAALTAGMSANAVIAGGNIHIVDTIMGTDYSFTIQQGGLTQAETSTIVTAIQSVLNTRLTTWQAMLAAM